MNANERIMKLCTANVQTLARVDAILNGTAPGAKSEVDYSLISISATQKMLAVSRPTVYRMIREGLIEVVRMFPDNVKDTMKVRRQSVIDFVNGKRTAAAVKG